MAPVGHQGPPRGGGEGAPAPARACGFCARSQLRDLAPDASAAISTARGVLGQGEGRRLRVLADRPSLTGVDDAPAELADALERRGEIADHEVGQREGVPGTASARSARRSAGSARVRLPASPSASGRASSSTPSSPVQKRRARTGVGGELDQLERRARHARTIATHRRGPSPRGPRTETLIRSLNLSPHAAEATRTQPRGSRHIRQDGGPPRESETPR